MGGGDVKVNRLVERLKEILGAIEVEPPIPLHAAFTPARVPSSRYALSYPIGAENPVAAHEVKADLCLWGIRAGWLAAGVMRGDPQFERSLRLTTETAHLLSDRLAALDPRSGMAVRRPGNSSHKLVFTSGDKPVHLDVPDAPDTPTEVQQLRCPLRVGGREVGCLKAAAVPAFSGLAESVAGILSERLEVLDLQSRLERAEAGAAALRSRLQELAGS